MCLGGGGQACRRSDDPFASAADAQERILSGSSLTLRRQACPPHPSPHPASSATKAGEQHQRFAILRAVDYWIILEDSGCSAVVPLAGVRRRGRRRARRLALGVQSECNV